MRVVIVGAGLIGRTIADMLSASPHYQGLLVVDHDAKALQALTSQGQGESLATQVVDAMDVHALIRTFKGDDVGTNRSTMPYEVVINALPYTFAVTVATAAKAAGAHYFDLTEDVQATAAIRDLAVDASTVLMPQCGLAPGFIGIAAHAVAQDFDTVHTIKMRVGALPQFPTNALKYNLTWSLDGLLNEYCQPCEAVREGKTQWVRPLEGLEALSLDGVAYEAFNTSGGLGTLCETWAGRVRSLDYKSIRYPGHRDRMAFLIEDMGLGHDRATLKRVMLAAVPSTDQDVVLVLVAVTGLRDGKLVEEVFARKVSALTLHGRTLTAIQSTTAGAVCAVVDLFREGQLPQQGFVRQEQVPLNAFLANRFASMYGPNTNV